MPQIFEDILRRMHCATWIGSSTYEHFSGVTFFEEKAVASLPEEDCENVRIVPRDERLGLRLDLADKKVAIVGNGSVSNCGKAIDRHDEVVRINSMCNWRQDPIHDGRRITLWTGNPVFVVERDKSGNRHVPPLFSQIVEAGIGLWALSPLHISVDAYRWLDDQNALDRLLVAPPSAVIQDISSRILDGKSVSTLFSIARGRDEIVGRTVYDSLLAETRLLILLELCGVKHMSLYGVDLFVNSKDQPCSGHNLPMDMRVILELKRRLFAKGGFFHWEEEGLVRKNFATLQRCIQSRVPFVEHHEYTLPVDVAVAKPKIALVLNDTSLWYHFGCFATSTVLANLLRDDGYDVATYPYTMTHGIKLTPACVFDLSDVDFFKAFCMNYPSVCQSMRDADIVVVNGEGTLHGFRPAPRNLLYLAMMARLYHDRPTYLVNHSLFPADKNEHIEEEQAAYYRQALAGLDGIAGREPLTLDIYNSLGIGAVQAFDLLPVFARHAGITAESEERDPHLVVVGVGVNWNAALAKQYAQVLKKTLPGPVRLVFLNGGPGQDTVAERLCLPAMAQIDPRIHSAAPFTGCLPTNHARCREWLRLIARAGLVVTGRFHHVVAALAFGTPVVALSSNTPKIEGVFKLLGFDQTVIDPRGKEFREQLEAALSGALAGRGQAVVTTADQQQRLCDLGMANALWRR